MFVNVQCYMVGKTYVLKYVRSVISLSSFIDI